MKPWRMRRLTRAFWLWLLFLGAVSSTQPAVAQSSLSVHLTMGNPSQARADESDRENFLIVHQQWAASWNSRLGHPNWVSWRLAADDLGEADRSKMHFDPDPEVPQDWPRIGRGLYAKTGFDLGHLCPAADRSLRMFDMKFTFLTTNCVPQAPQLNRGVWERMEAYRRERAGAGKELYIVAGPAGRGGRGSKGYAQEIGDDRRRVNVPAYCWAAWLELDDRDGDDLARVTGETTVNAVIFHNDDEVRPAWQNALHSVRDVEQLTGFDLFDLVPRDAQHSLEGRTAKPGE